MSMKLWRPLLAVIPIMAFFGALLIVPASADDITDECTYIWQVSRWAPELGASTFVEGFVCVRSDGSVSPLVVSLTELEFRLQLRNARFEIMELRGENETLRRILSVLPWQGYTPGAGND